MIRGLDTNWNQRSIFFIFSASSHKFFLVSDLWLNTLLIYLIEIVSFLQPFNCLKWTIDLKVGLFAMNLLHHKFHRMVYVIKTMKWPMKTHWPATFLQIHISVVID